MEMAKSERIFNQNGVGFNGSDGVLRGCFKVGLMERPSSGTAEIP